MLIDIVKLKRMKPQQEIGILDEISKFEIIDS